MKLLKDKYPELIKEWDFDKNSHLDLNKIKYKSGKKVSWICQKDNRHQWKSTINSRTCLKSGCPFCSGRVVLKEDSLAIKLPNLLKEWNNKNTIDPFTISPKSNKKVWWICNKEHEWQTYHRANGSGCPYCLNKKVGYGNSFGDNYPDLLKEWNYERNIIDPFSILAGSHKKVYWTCQNNHSWQATIKDRALENNGCVRCCKKVSKPSQIWLDSLNIKEDNREIYINVNGKRFFADGFNPKTNTIYEYFGDFWHGNPEIYNKNEIHPILKVSFGFLYDRTLEKIKILEDAGYNIIYKWGP